MIKTHHFDGFFNVAEPQKLSIIVSCSLTDRGVQFAPCERDRRNVSSLTNGIDPCHPNNNNKVRIQESMAKKARGLHFHADRRSSSTPPILGTSGEQLTIAERRTS